MKLSGLANSERQKDCIDFWYGRHLKKCAKQKGPRTVSSMIDNLFADPSQAVHRGGCREGLPTLCRSTLAYSFKHDVVLSGYAHVKLLGHAEVKAWAELSDVECRELAGEAYSVPWQAACHFLLWANPYSPRWQ